VNARNIAASLFAVLAAAAHSAEPPSLESLAAPLLQAQTYCESGSFGASTGPNDPLPENRYRVCAHRDGRFKYVLSPGEASQIVTWSDGRKLHRYVEYGGGYQQRDVAARDAGDFYEKPRETVPALHSVLFRWATRGGAGLDLLGSLRDYRVNAELSDARRTVHERMDGDRRGGTRIRVATADGALLRYERMYDGIVRGYVEIDSREIGRPLTAADLAQDVPLTQRYSLQNNAPVFVAALFVVAALAGLAFWAWRFARAEHPYDVVIFRRILWRVFAWAFGGVASILGFLAFLTWGGKGHPPAIVFVIGLAGLAGLAFGLVACFLLSSYVVQAFPRNRIARVTPD
jgi:hypothetical protein